MTDDDGPWLDMSAFPDTDPDDVVSHDQHEHLRSALSVDPAALPDPVWNRLVAVAVGDETAGDDAEAADAEFDDDSHAATTDPDLLPTDPPGDHHLEPGLTGSESEHCSQWWGGDGYAEPDDVSGNHQGPDAHFSLDAP